MALITFERFLSLSADFSRVSEFSLLMLKITLRLMADTLRFS